MTSADYANYILGKCEDSAQAMLQLAVTGGHITTIASDSIDSGISPNDLGNPRVTCICTNAQCEDFTEGIWLAELKVEVTANAADHTKEQFRHMCGEVWHRFFRAQDDVCTALSNATVQFTAFMVRAVSQEGFLVTDEESAEWQGTLTLSVRCCGSVIA
jgi:hypothetical protein